MGQKQFETIEGEEISLFLSLIVFNQRPAARRILEKTTLSSSLIVLQ